MATKVRRWTGRAAAAGFSVLILIGPLAGAAAAVRPSVSASAPADSGYGVPAAEGCRPVNIWVNDDSHLYEFGPDGSLLSTVPTGNFLDLAWDSSGTVLYGATGDQLSVIDPRTGTSTALPPVTGLLPVVGGAGNLVYTIDPTTSVATLLATLPRSLRIAGGFVAMENGDTLIAATDRALHPDPTTGAPRGVLVRLHADGTATEIGTLPGVRPFGATSSGGRVYLADGAGHLVRVDGTLPTAQSTDPLAYSLVAQSPGSSLLGATSKQEGVCAIPDLPASLIGPVAAAGAAAGLVAASVLAFTAVRRRRDGFRSRPESVFGAGVLE